MDPPGKERLKHQQGARGTAFPSLPADTVDRSRLSHHLERGVRDALTLISALAGYGKTLAAAAWARDRPPTAPPLATLT